LPGSWVAQQRKVSKQAASPATAGRSTGVPEPAAIGHRREKMITGLIGLLILVAIVLVLLKVALLGGVLGLVALVLLVLLLLGRL
jgi:hypothetical protein